MGNLGRSGQFGKMVMSLPNHGHEYTESVQRSSPPHFTFKVVSLKLKDDLGVESYTTFQVVGLF